MHQGIGPITETASGFLSMLYASVLCMGLPSELNGTMISPPQLVCLVLGIYSRSCALVQNAGDDLLYNPMAEGDVPAFYRCAQHL